MSPTSNHNIKDGNFCPLLQRHCLGKCCAWWTVSGNKCGVLDLAFSLDYLCDQGIAVHKDDLEANHD